MKNLCLKSNAPQYDSFDRRFRKMHSDVIEGKLDMSHEEVNALYHEELEESLQYVEPLEPRTAGVPTDEKVGAGFSRDSVTGEVREPECGNVSRFGENV